MMMPTAISDWSPTRRPTVSASVSNTAPARALAGMRTRWSVPRIIRSTWGTMRPTKAIGPVTAVVVPQSSTAPSVARTRVRVKLMPRLVATSSPRESALRPLLVKKTMTNPSPSNGKATVSDSYCAPLTEPICQLRNSSMTSARGNKMALVKLDRAAAVAAPARASLSGVAPPWPIDPTQ